MHISILFRTGCFLFLFIRLLKPAKPAFLISCDSIFQLKLYYHLTKKVGVRLPFPFLSRAKGSFSFYQKVCYLLVAVIECISHFMLAPTRASWSVIDETLDFYQTYSIAWWARRWGLALQEIEQPFFPYLVCFPAYRATSQLAKERGRGIMSINLYVHFVRPILACLVFLANISGFLRTKRSCLSIPNSHTFSRKTDFFFKFGFVWKILVHFLVQTNPN